MRISVALCTYNGEKFLKTQLESILNQTVKVNEIIVCDDLSTDKTKEILDYYAKSYPNLFKIYHNKKNLKSNKNFEKAIKLTTGEYIFLSDQDDLWKENKIEETLLVFKKNKNALGVFSNADLIDDNSNFINKDIKLWDTVYFKPETLKKHNLFEQLILKGNFVTGATLCIKKETLKNILPFKTHDKIFLHDEWIAYCLSKNNSLFFSEKTLISYRLHSNQQIGVDFNYNVLSKKKTYQKYGVFDDIYKPKSFKDFKIVTSTLFNQYQKYKRLNFYETLKSFKLLALYLKADKEMKKSNPILYFFRKQSDKKKGKRQLNCV